MQPVNEQRANALEVSLLLADTLLDGRTVDTVPVAGGDVDALVVECDPSEALEAWTACRAIVDRTHRWPIFACEWAEGSVAKRLEHGPPLPLDTESSVNDDASIKDALSAVSTTDGAWESESQWGFVSYELELVVKSVGSAPKMDLLKESLGREASVYDVKNWLFRWQIENGPVDSLESDDSHLIRFDPSTYCGTGLALLPCDNGWDSFSYLDFYGAWNMTSAAKVVLRSWYERFGAELWSNYSTMLDFVVQRPPTDLEGAWHLAVEQERFAPSTTLLPGVPTLDHACALIGRDTWHLHERP